MSTNAGGSGTATTPLMVSDCSAVTLPAPLKYHVPVLPLAFQFTTRNVTVVVAGTFWRAAIADREIDDCALPELVVVLPHVMLDPMFVKVLPSIEYCHWPVVGPEADRRMLYAAISLRESS